MFNYLHLKLKFVDELCTENITTINVKIILVAVTSENQLDGSADSKSAITHTTQASFSSTKKKTIIYNTVTVYQDSAPLDIALGLIFGVIGLAVIGIAVYHLVKKQRRSMRRRRLLNRYKN